jgi:hypothetical protein
LGCNLGWLSLLIIRLTVLKSNPTNSKNYTHWLWANILSFTDLFDLGKLLTFWSCGFNYKFSTTLSNVFTSKLNFIIVNYFEIFRFILFQNLLLISLPLSSFAIDLFHSTVFSLIILIEHYYQCFDFLRITQTSQYLS